jgi:hypothetical protein
MLQISTKRESGNRDDRQQTRQKFLDAFETTCGNVSASCEYAGIARQTYYRWMRSLTAVNIQFRDRLSRIKPNDRLVDLAESRLMQKIGEGDIAAIIFTLKTKGRLRGWSERNESRTDAPDRREPLDKAAEAFELWLNDHPHSDMSTREEWLNRFADALRVDVDLLSTKCLSQR